MRGGFGAAVLIAAGCSGSSPAETDVTGSGTGTLALRFAIDDDWHAAMSEPAKGPFWGSIYLADEVTGAGPVEGAVALWSIEVAEVDLTSGAPTAALHVTGALPIGWVTVLGFMDSDGNALVDAPDPDDDDPVTLPNENEFEVLEDAETEVEVFFGLLKP